MTMLRVHDADLHYQVRGAGPFLLIAQSGEGDADRSVDLVDHLTGDHTVITYDRRGLSRSTGTAASVRQHADDVHRLLAHLTDRPVIMLGQSLGASIGLHLAMRHPEQLSLLIAHEPVSPWLLPAAERDRHRTELAEIRALYLESGLPAALKEVARVLGITPPGAGGGAGPGLTPPGAGGGAEPGLTPQPMTARRRANFDFFIRHDFHAVIEDDLDLTGCRTRVLPAAGLTTPAAVFDRRCADELAALLRTEVALLPGGHNGNLTHPRAYAARLRELLRELPPAP
ncbi:pimeloyl-ACP methyl ester carboxylesterase [Nonomuraea thailandensis]|uniref:Pimeloyl-ACP methyl ester carboxylesterase n=1 Tax=Nonomuraea thailandensis TaxID=1188745 RepID=A0A9X2GLP9_9ACTN|nr:alpha/beta hydrolase [Nonomuraea thailandensis]MCP2361514.1 pimeloyl-ACP methyl ester carboxylesterase [Nonomuraea thailandensis]